MAFAVWMFSDASFILGVGSDVSYNIDDEHFPPGDTLNYGGVENIDEPGLVNDGFLYSLYDQNAIDNGTYRCFREDRSPDSTYYYEADFRPNWRPDRFRYFTDYVFNRARAWYSNESFGLLEVPRRKLIVEASYPISHTTCWEHDDEKRRMQFQEFKVVPEMHVSASTITDEVVFIEKAYTGAVKFLDNHGTLSLKKLFEGQLQALRIDVLEELEDDDDVRTRVPVKMLHNGFMYLKWLFTKETV